MKEEMAVELVKWAHNATKQSYNKPTLPHLVIAVNSENEKADQNLYDIEKAKETLMKQIKNVHHKPQMTPYTKHWGNLDPEKEINSGEALLGCYYSSVNVIHFPDQYYPTKMCKQIDELYKVLSKTCQKSQNCRAEMQMKLDAATFPLYTRKAFSHFASSFDQPFDFKDAWFDLNPVSFDFKSAIIRLACDVSKDLNVKGMELWEKLTDFIAACFLLNWRRIRIHGESSQPRCCMRTWYPLIGKNRCWGRLGT
jgi:hypothetical protein